MSEKVYTYNEYVLSYDMDEENNRSCMIISKTLNGNLYVMTELYDGSADIVSIMLDNLQTQLHQKENIIKEVRQYIENNSLYEQDYDYDYEENLVEYPPSDEQARKDILEILDKENI